MKMIKKWTAALVTLCITMGLLVITFSGLVQGKTAPTPPPPKLVDYTIERQYNHTDDQIKKQLMAGWQLGGVYRDCGNEFGIVNVTTDIDALLLPTYKKLAQKNQDEMLVLLRKTLKEKDAQDAMNRIIAGEEKLTKYGTLPDYSTLQERFEKLSAIIAEIEKKPASGVASVDEALKTLEKFVASGDAPDAGAAKKAVQTLGQILEGAPETFFDPKKDTGESMGDVARIRQSVVDTLAKAEKLGGGCRMVYVYYKPVMK